MIYFIADTHFGHKNIIKFCNRPFKDTYEMNKIIIDNWNNTVREEDIIYHLGDFSYRINEERIKPIVEGLKGKITLLMGNHDRRLGKEYWEEKGFYRVYDQPIVLNETYLLSHEPISDSKFFNIHGHTHNHPIENHLHHTSMSVSVELIKYKPISIKEIERRIVIQ